MVAGVFLVERTTPVDDHDVNRVRTVVCQADDGDADAVIIAEVVANLNTLIARGDGLVASGNADPYPAGYFDTVTQIGATPAGPLATDEDFIAMGDIKFSVTT